tara:strand:+ start:472 stop:678 length:207 start_codon:yes stop_codon:yes gene_type:complete
MEKQKIKVICDHCQGNGYLRINTSSHTEVHQCPTCNSQGEVEADLLDDDTTLEDLKNLLEDVNKARLQ